MPRFNRKTLIGRLLGIVGAALGLVHVTAQAAAPGITGPSFDLTAEPAYVNQPDGTFIYSWGYGCNTAPAGFAPAAVGGANCPTMQVPGPTMIVHQGDIVTVTLHNNLPAAAGNTSMLFPGFTMLPFTDGSAGLLTQEAAHGGTVTYRFVATNAGTHPYYSGTQGDLQVEMGLYGAVIVLPTLGGSTASACDPTGGTGNDKAKVANGEADFRLSKAAYDHPKTCYDREYLFQISEIDPRIHRQAEEQAALACTQPTGCMTVETEPYHPAYFIINGRSFPDTLDPNYATQYPHQPYNANPHVHPGEVALLREIGTGRLQHPFHEHGNHLRVLARDGNLLLTSGSNLAGPLLFTTTSTPGQSMDALYYWTGKGLNWDAYGHGYAGDTSACIPDANGYHTGDPAAPNYFEWCGDHNKALENKPFGNVAGGGPITLPDPNILANGAHYSGSPYMGPDALQRAAGGTPIPPSGTVGNESAGFAFMWHSHNERELTTNNAFPGGMMTMMLVDPRSFQIDETN